MAHVTDHCMSFHYPTNPTWYLPEFKLIWLVSELLRLWAELWSEFKLFESLSINLLAASNFARSCNSAVGIDSFSIFRTLLLSDSDVESVMLYELFWYLVCERFLVFYGYKKRIIYGRKICLFPQIILVLCDVMPGSLLYYEDEWWQ